MFPRAHVAPAKSDRVREHIRSVAPDGARHVRVQNHSRLFRVLANDFQSSAASGAGAGELPAVTEKRSAMVCVLASDGISGGSSLLPAPGTFGRDF